MTVGKILRSRDGQVVVFVALAFVLLGLLVGLAVDSGRAYLLQARLSRLADAVALAGAKGMHGGTTPEEKTALAQSAACDAALVNGYGCGGNGAEVCVTVVCVTIGNIETAEGPVLGVTVTASDMMSPSFMSLGTLVGCTTCSNDVTVAATASAVPMIIPADVVLVMDDTISMDLGCNDEQTDSDCPNFNAREGATALVNALLPEGSPSEMLIGMVPFRGCYHATDNRCVRPGEIVDLTNDKAALIGERGSLGCSERCDNGTGIQGLWAQGKSGTNICLGIYEGRNRLFGAGSRTTARKIMIILTDLENAPISGLPSLPPADCNSINANTLDSQTNNLATAIKDAPPPNNVEIFVLGYSVNSGNDRNLGQSVASSTPGTNNHYFEAATSEMIQTQFGAIADALKTLRLIN